MSEGKISEALRAELVRLAEEGGRRECLEFELPFDPPLVDEAEALGLLRLQLSGGMGGVTTEASLTPKGWAVTGIARPSWLLSMIGWLRR